MATKSTAIILPSTEEIQKLPKFTEALDTLGKLNDELTRLENRARQIEINDANSFVEAGVLNASRKDILKQAEATVDPYKAPLRKWLDFVQQHFNVVKNHCEQMKGVLEPKMQAYDLAEKRKAADEAARIKREEEQRIAREAEEKRKADLAAAQILKNGQIATLKASLKAGNIGKRAYLQALKAIDAQNEELKELAELEAEERKNTKVEVTVKPNVPTVPGNVKRTNYKAVCNNPALFLIAVLAAWENDDKETFVRLSEMIAIDHEKLSAKAREIKDSKKMMELYPQVYAWEDKSF